MGVRRAKIVLRRANMGVSRAKIVLSRANMGVSRAKIVLSRANIGVSRAKIAISEVSETQYKTRTHLEIGDREELVTANPEPYYKLQYAYVQEVKHGTQVPNHVVSVDSFSDSSSKLSPCHLWTKTSLMTFIFQNSLPPLRLECYVGLHT
ncbi:hypothetical protein Bpfe_013195 [Biomphalaria pfeifferi]|uniref:Uncharacterized protein n=1 Tax=Biomphalaria pfeifferi TaxID=112525 RepID=A0AAD8BMN1_BIOPF|nr:hypothetical protein Bpfe_013195 [Biomphalaria pfeifferi]